MRMENDSFTFHNICFGQLFRNIRAVIVSLVPPQNCCQCSLKPLYCKRSSVSTALLPLLLIFVLCSCTVLCIMLLACLVPNETAVQFRKSKSYNTNSCCLIFNGKPKNNEQQNMHLAPVNWNAWLVRALDKWPFQSLFWIYFKFVFIGCELRNN